MVRSSTRPPRHSLHGPERRTRAPRRCPFPTVGNADLLLARGSREQIDTRVRPVVEDRFPGTGRLSGPRAGSSPADVRTRAEPQPAGSFRLDHRTGCRGTTGALLAAAALLRQERAGRIRTGRTGIGGQGPRSPAAAGCRPCSASGPTDATGCSAGARLGSGPGGTGRDPRAITAPGC
ncbi:hypothetical protein GCM10025734_73400 [Kitasatospora paranensis]